jgi:hypothetical protein
MDNNTVITVFVIIAAVALLAQAVVLIGIAITAKRMQAKMTEAFDRMNVQLNPLLATTRDLLEFTGPKLKSVATDAAAISEIVHRQTVRLESTVENLLEHTDDQVDRVSTMVTDALDDVEEAKLRVEAAIVRPLRMALGISNGLKAAFGTFFDRRDSRSRYDEDDAFGS